jgi:uncharacterized membrane protein
VDLSTQRRQQSGKIVLYDLCNQPTELIVVIIIIIIIIIIILLLLLLLLLSFLVGIGVQWGPSPPVWTSPESALFLTSISSFDFPSINIYLHTAPPSVVWSTS